MISFADLGEQLVILAFFFFHIDAELLVPPVQKLDFLLLAFDVLLPDGDGLRDFDGVLQKRIGKSRKLVASGDRNDIFPLRKSLM